MGVDAVHTQYAAFSNRWKKCRDGCAGEEAVKSGRESYLPRLEAQQVPEYDRYLMRALYVNASGKTKDSYAGLIFRKDVEVTAPALLKELVDSFEDDFTRQHNSLWCAAKDTVRDILEVGRGGWLVDVSANNTTPKPHGSAVYYKAEDIVNWQTEDREGSDTLVRVILREAFSQPTKDEFTSETAYRYRVLRLTDAGLYTQQVYLPVKGKNGETDWVGGEIITPSRQGDALLEIPFTFVGPNNALPDVDRPPLEDLVDVNLSHYRTMADLENARHWVGVPTPVFCGFDFAPGSTVQIGSSGGISAKDSTAKATFLEFTGQGLGALTSASKEKSDYMAALGARLLKDQIENETAEAARIRSTGESATLSSISGTVSEALTLVLRWLVWWAGADDVSGIEVVLNNQFVDSGLDAMTLTALISARQSGLISEETFLWNLKKGNMLDPSGTIELEMERIASDPGMGGKIIELEDKHSPPQVGPGAAGGKAGKGSGPTGSAGGADLGTTGESQGAQGASQVVQVV